MIPQNSFHFRIEFPRFDVTLCERGKKLLEFVRLNVTFRLVRNHSNKVR